MNEEGCLIREELQRKMKRRRTREEPADEGNITARAIRRSRPRGS
jgi:hypothetical protein